MHEAVVVTGMGLVTSIGIGKEAFFKAALAGRSGVIRLSHPVFDEAALETRIAAPIVGFDPVAHHVPARDIALLDPFAQFAMAATHEALLDADLSPVSINPRKGLHALPGVDSERVGVILGTGIGGFTTLVNTALAWQRTRRRTACVRYAVPMSIPNAASAQVAIRFGARGETKTLNAACASGLMAIGEAFRLVRSGELEVAIAGGVEAILQDEALFGLLGFDLIKSMSRRNDAPESASRPFDRERDGYVLSEGAGIVILEREEHAKARGAAAYGQIRGYATTSEGFSMLSMDPSAEQVTRVLSRALQSADVPREAISYINAHGTATVLSDQVECRAIRSAFGPHADQLAVTSTKSMTGHAVAASGPIGLIQTLLSMRHSILPPTINLEHPDPACDLDFVPLRPRAARIEAAMVNAFGFGGHNASIVVTSA